MAVQANLLIDQNADFLYTVTLIDSNNEAIDLTGYSVYSQLRTSYTSNNYIDMNATINDPPTSGIITLSMAAGDTAMLTATRYVYDLDVVSSNNITSRIMQGIATINPGVTR